MDIARIELLAGDLGTAEHELRRAEKTLTALGERYLLPPLAALLAQVVYRAGTGGRGRGDHRAGRAPVRRRRRGAAGGLALGPGEGAGRPGPVGEAEPLARDAVRLVRTTDSPWMQADALLDLAEVLRRADGRTRPGLRRPRRWNSTSCKGDTAAAARAAAVLDALVRLR